MSTPTPRPGRFTRSPVVLRDGQWWLVSRAGSILATDPTFTSALDGYAQAIVAADQAVADLRARESESPPRDTGGQR
ncbi:hypothetical protein OYE22_31080 [Streptomyces sp. 71268]|uniref:hypothetical protein n=1 Tax=Streptomyces sp. 71268 TaxID=3002640 RepID=UPI0023FA28B2|nr:hypothetical protein [Streptomyces sp. 71268]WEV29135.1 hypothetical protein OYE22_31080 [Streptomyces sp. 71268]